MSEHSQARVIIALCPGSDHEPQWGVMSASATPDAFGGEWVQCHTADGSVCVTGRADAVGDWAAGLAGAIMLHQMSNNK